MLELTTELLEVRGIQDVTSKKGNVYYNLNAENVTTGEAYKFFVTDSNLFPDNLKKGSKIYIVASYNMSYKDLRVKKILPADK